ncbi:Uncharacterised protein [Segatella copri]|nr:Uncharacterised protein [Segatella copri]
MIQGSVDRLVKLFLLHVYHLLDVTELQVQQRKERKAHDNGYGPNRFLLHGGKDKKFLNQLT